MKKIIPVLSILIFAAYAYAMEFEHNYDPSIDFTMGIIDDNLTFGISTEIPFWTPSFLRIRYQHNLKNDNDIRSDMISIDLLFRNKNIETSGYRFSPFIAIGGHYLFPDHDNYDLSSSIGFQAFIGFYYRISPFNYLYIEGGGIRKNFKPKSMSSYEEDSLIVNIGYKIVF